MFGGSRLLACAVRHFLSAPAHLQASFGDIPRGGFDANHNLMQPFHHRIQRDHQAILFAALADIHRQISGSDFFRHLHDVIQRRNHPVQRHHQPILLRAFFGRDHQIAIRNLFGNGGDVVHRSNH